MGLVLRLCAILATILHVALVADEKSFSAEESINLVPSTSLGGICLKGLQGFALIPLYSVEDNKMRAKLYEEIAKELKQMGEIVILTPPDVTGFGKSDARLILNIQDVHFISAKQLPVVQVSLSASATVTIAKTKERCSSDLWSLSAFTQGQVQEKNLKNILPTLKAVLEQFITDYRSNNPEQKERPTFYIYQS